MELYEEITQNLLFCAIQYQDAAAQKSAWKELVESECYTALASIKEIPEDDSQADASCFQKIEEIICVYEKIGSYPGSRHDFG